MDTARIEQCPRCGRRGVLGYTGAGPRCGTCVTNAVHGDDPHAPEMHGPRRYQRRGPAPATELVAGAFYVVRGRGHRRTLDGFPVSGACVTNSVGPDDTVLAGPYPELHQARADLLVRTGSYPDTTTALANRHRWDSTVRATT